MAHEWRITMLADFLALLTADEAQAQPTIDVTETQRRLDSGAALLIDVREPEEWRDGHVPGAVHLPLGQLDARLSEIPREQDILLFCRSGNRSGRATAALRSIGFTRVTNVSGGILAWTEQGLPLERDQD
jgi:rhodanese-related sulfurtransferase